MEAPNLNTNNMQLVACIPPDDVIAMAMYTIRMPLPDDPMGEFLKLNSTPNHYYTYEVHLLDINCHHCHQDHVIKYIFAAWKTGAAAKVEPPYTIEMRDDGVGRDFNIGDYVLTVIVIAIDPAVEAAS